MNTTWMGCTYKACLTSAERLGRCSSRVASFSVVMMMAGLFIILNWVFIASASDFVYWWWSLKCMGVMLVHLSFMSTIICSGEAMPLNSNTLGSSPDISRGLPSLNSGLSGCCSMVVKYSSW